MVKAPDTQLRSLDSHMGAGETWLIRKNELFIFQISRNADRDGNVINVFSRDAAGIYSHVATLAASGNDSVGGYAVSGRRVIAACGGIEACVFDIPASLAQPAVIQDTFAGTTPAGWTTSAGSAFSIATSGPSRVLRRDRDGEHRDAHCVAHGVERGEPGSAGRRARHRVQRRRSLARPGDPLRRCSQPLLCDAARLGQRLSEAHA